MKYVLCFIFISFFQSIFDISFESEIGKQVIMLISALSFLMAYDYVKLKMFGEQNEKT